MICFPFSSLNHEALFHYSPIQPATPIPSATTSATLLPPSPRGAAPVALALALAPVAVVVATPDKLSVEPLGLAAVPVEATDVVDIGLGSVGRVMTVPLEVDGVEVSEVGMVKPEAVVRGMDTSA